LAYDLAVVAPIQFSLCGADGGWLHARLSIEALGAG